MVNNVDEQVRRSLHELADQGRPVNLGRAALAGARRRRRARVGIGVVAVAGVAAVALVLPIGLAGGGEPTGEVTPMAGAEQVVITYYLASDPLAGYALDPDTGEYHRDAVPPSSPDLRHTISDSGGFVLNLADRSRQRIPWPQPARDVWWSPDGTHLAATAGPSVYSGPERPITAVQVVDLAAETGWEIPLDLPAHHAGTGLFWLDSQRLAIPLTNLLRQPAVEIPPRYGWPSPDGIASESGIDKRIVYEVQVYAPDGTLVERLPVDQSDLATSGIAGLVWHVSGVASDGKVVLMRHPDETTLELATLDASGQHHRATLTLPEPPSGHYWGPAAVVLALAGGQLLVGVEQHTEPAGDDSELQYVTTAHYVVDLTTGTVREANVPDLPDNGRPWIYADAAALAPAAAHSAFTP